MKKRPVSKISQLPTYVYIDGSNIQNACSKSLRFKIDMKKFIAYLNTKYPNLKRVVYLEGASLGDMKKEALFEQYRSFGYEVLSLERKSYVSQSSYKQAKCQKCGHPYRIKVANGHTSLKSNIDVYLTSEFQRDAFKLVHPGHLILVSCDGDYVEMIKGVLTDNPSIQISVLATPYTKNFNYLSSRYKELRREGNFRMLDISLIKSHIKK
jgi:uncharacterized LabA/DUF88 family protein